MPGKIALQGYETSDGFQGKIMMIESDGIGGLAFLTPPTPTPDYEFNLPQWAFDGKRIYADSQSAYNFEDTSWDNSTYYLWSIRASSGAKALLYTHVRGPGSGAGSASSYNPLRKTTVDGPMLSFHGGGPSTSFDSTLDADPILPYGGGGSTPQGVVTVFSTPHYFHVADIPTAGLVKGDSWYVGPPDDLSGNPIFGRLYSWEYTTPSTWYAWPLSFGPDTHYADYHDALVIVRDVVAGTSTELVTADDVNALIVSETGNTTFAYTNLGPAAISNDGSTLILQAINNPYRIYPANPRTYGTPTAAYYLACDATDGSDLRILFGGTTQHTATPPTDPAITDYQDVIPRDCFSPDDSKILYIQVDSPTASYVGVGLINPDGTGKTDIWTASGTTGRIFAVWSPDGLKIIMAVGNASFDEYKVVSINPDGTGEHLHATLSIPAHSFTAGVSEAVLTTDEEIWVVNLVTDTATLIWTADDVTSNDYFDPAYVPLPMAPPGPILDVEFRADTS